LITLSEKIEVMEEASQLYAVLLEQQSYNPSQAVKVLVGFKYCTTDEAWTIAKLYHAKKGIYDRLTNKQFEESDSRSRKTTEFYA